MRGDQLYYNHYHCFGQQRMHNIIMIHRNKPQGQVYVSSAFRSVRHHSFSKNRYVPTTNATFSITSNNNTSFAQPRLSINDELLQRRKANHLQSQSNKREVVFKEISKQNKILYKRLNSQKSMYSQQSLSKSTVSMRSISQNSSRSSLKKAQNINKKKLSQLKIKKMKQKIKLQPQNVNNIQKTQLNEFKKIFGHDHFMPATTRQRYISNKTSNTHFIDPRNIKNISSSKKGQSHMMGNLLHKIAQQFYLPVPKTARQHYKNQSKKF